MSFQLRPISDPEEKDAKAVEMGATMDLKSIVIKKKVALKVDAKSGGPQRIPQQIDVQKVTEKVLSAIQEVTVDSVYHIGKDGNQWDCGPVLEVIPSGSFKNISTGETVTEHKTALKSKELAVKLDPKKDHNFVIVVGADGCILLKPNSSAVINMPVFVVEPTGDYYHTNKRARELQLGAGSHLILYTKTIPILYVSFPKVVLKVAPKVTVASKPEKKKAPVAQNTVQIQSPTSKPKPTPPPTPTPKQTVPKTIAPTDRNASDTTGEAPDSKWKPLLGMVFFLVLILMTFLIYWVLIRRKRHRTVACNCRICGSPLHRNPY